MKTAKEFIEAITTASNENNIMGLISLHDDLLKVEISVLSKTVKYIKATDEITYSVLSTASAMSKVEKNGIFNRIIKQAMARELLTEEA